MRRADRLFRLVQLLRRSRVVTAQRLAQELEVAERTVYRDIRDLSLSGVPIRGEAGVGYALAHGFDLPPLMFSEEEIEALVLGARVVQSWADPALAKAADSVLAKVEMVLPDKLRSKVAGSTLLVPDFHTGGRAPNLGALRGAIREGRKVHFRYLDESGKESPHGEAAGTRLLGEDLVDGVLVRAAPGLPEFSARPDFGDRLSRDFLGRAGQDPQ